MNNPLVSVVTVSFNSVSDIEDTILNVVEQTYSNVEYIIVDGGSTDGTYEKIRQYGDKITHWISEPDQGIYDAMNKGIAIATGEWLIFMNSGDKFYSANVLEDIFSASMHDNTDIIYGNTWVKNSNKLIIVPRKINKNFFFFNTLCHQSVFFRKTSFKKIGGYNLNYKIIADREWLLKAIIAKLNFKFTDVYVSIWDSVGFSSKNIGVFSIETRRMLNAHFNIFESTFLRLRSRIYNFSNKLKFF